MNICVRVGLTSRRRSEAGGDGREEELRGHKEEKGSKRHRRASIRGGTVDREREEGGGATPTQCDLLMQPSQFIAHNQNDQTASFPSFSLKSYFNFSGS